jgi:hypothetical protein
MRIHTLSIKWMIEMPTALDEVVEPTNSGATAKQKALEAWQDLRGSHPELEEEMNSLPHGILRPGPTIQADVCLLRSPQLGFFLHLLLRNPQTVTWKHTLHPAADYHSVAAWPETLLNLISISPSPLNFLGAVSFR